MKDPHSEDLILNLPVQSETMTKLVEIRAMLMHYASHYLKMTPGIDGIVEKSYLKATEIQCKTRVQSLNSCLFSTTKNHLALKKISGSANLLTDNSGNKLSETASLENISLEEVLEAGEEFDLFYRAIRDLPIKCQRVFVLRKVYGFSPAEISKYLSISINTVEEHLEKGIVRYTEFMEAEELRDATTCKKTKFR